MLHVDIETFSSISISDAGAYKYVESLDFEILLVAFAFDDEPTQIVDIASGEALPKRFLDALTDNNVIKVAHNATFERICFAAEGFVTPPSAWVCTAVMAAACGYPRSLAEASLAMGLIKGKMEEGKDLIKLFCVPCKPTRTNRLRYRNLPSHFPEKWETFKAYCVRDVDAEREIYNLLAKHQLPTKEWNLYALDQRINDRGVKIDIPFAKTAIELDRVFSETLTESVKKLTGLANPNSVAQLKDWLGTETGKSITSLDRAAVAELLDDATGGVKEVLLARQQLSKSSISKYTKMVECACDDDRARGLTLFYAARTARWAGRLIQLQNLPQNHLKDLDGARRLAAAGDLEAVEMCYDVPNLLSQLIRTALIASDDNTFAVADFSAIEARVIAWLAGEQWRLDVFASHGKIYEASASKMFHVPVDSIEKGSAMRQKGKVAELALGYQGSVGALEKMGGEAMGLDKAEMQHIVKAWRAANPAIVSMWSEVEECAHKAVALKTSVKSIHKGLVFACDGEFLTIKLPSGRCIYYVSPAFTTNRFNQPSLSYMGVESTSKKWMRLETYGGKLVENIVQAISRDLLGNALLNLDRAGYAVVFHVHDEAIADIPKVGSDEALERMCSLMCDAPDWAAGLPLKADGYTTDYYKKD